MDKTQEQAGWISVAVLAAVVACVVAAVAVIDWQGHTAYAVAFCFVVPGVLGGVLNAATSAKPA